MLCPIAPHMAAITRNKINPDNVIAHLVFNENDFVKSAVNPRKILCCCHR